MGDILFIAKKEYKSFFSSPAAYLFLGSFVGASLFVFFWVETFFARNIADIRPLFQWLPLLLIFLVAALTMRSWSEEKRSGTVEALLTSPMPNQKIILGKFFASLGLILLAMVLTFPLPLTVSFLGDVDWGPVIGGYLATFFLAASYISIGLFTSSRTDNPIVSLIMTTLLCGFFYLLGSQLITGLLGHNISSIFNLFGTGTRFESITRGVVDLRDLVYYLSLVTIFLTLNLYTLEKSKWSKVTKNNNHKNWNFLVALIVGNCFLLNIWLYPINWFRADLTEGSLYSLSKTTKNQMKELREPLLIRGYFSERSHPLLSPLVPQLKDILTEYELVSGGKVTLEIIDPQKDSELEEEAATKYAVKPVPFQTASRHQAEVVNSYFDIVIAYGDQYETLSYADLIEAKASANESGVEVRLKNPEYSITRGIKKAVSSFRSEGNPLDSIKEKVSIKFYVSGKDVLPSELKPVLNDLISISKNYQDKYKDKFFYELFNPDNNPELEKTLEEFGAQAQVTNIIDPKPFWFSVFVEKNNYREQIQFVDSLEKDALKKAIDGSLKRLAPGYLRTVALVTPTSGQSFNRLKQVLSENLKVAPTDLKEGIIPENADMLLILAPNRFNDLQVKAVDQFLMKGGSVIIATSPFNVQVGQSITAKPYNSGLEDWLSNLGYEIESEMVLDPKSASLPIPVQRFIGGIPVREIQLVPYPHFPDIRSDAISSSHPITSSLNQMTLNWTSPITIDEELTQDNNVKKLLFSSSSSWTSENLNVIPDFNSYPDSGFSDVSDRGSEVLAIAASGPFNSYFEGADELEDDKKLFDTIITSSPKSSRLVLISSNSFAADGAIDLASHALNTLYTKPLEFIQNAADWSTEDQSLLKLRGKSQFARTLEPMSEENQQIWEIFTYILVILGLFAIWIFRLKAAKKDKDRYKSILQESS